MDATKQIIGDNFESGGGNMNIAKDQATAIQTNYTVTPQSSVEEVLKLFVAVRQELSKLPVPEAIKAEVLNELDGAELQAKKPAPDKTKIADKLKNATAALEESAKTMKGAVTIGNLLGQAILWCGEQWMNWGIMP